MTSLVSWEICLGGLSVDNSKKLATKIILLLENIPGPMHPNEKYANKQSDFCCVKHQNKIWSSKVVSLLQPLEQRVIETSSIVRTQVDALNPEWRKWLQTCLVSFKEKLTNKDAIFWCAEAWQKLQSSTITNSWNPHLGHNQEVCMDECTGSQLLCMYYGTVSSYIKTLMHGLYIRTID